MLAVMLRRLFETLILPPASVLLLLLLGTALRRWRPRLGRALQVVGVVWLLLASMPCVGGLLLHSLQTYPALDASRGNQGAQAIVVLSAGADVVAAEYGAPVIGPLTMQRLRYAAILQRRLQLPMLVSGGAPRRDAPTLASMMQWSAKNELGVACRWSEGRSADTGENAQFSAEMLKQDGIAKVLLVTSAWHMPRAIGCFRTQGIEVIAAPTGFRGEIFASWTSFVPHWNGLRDTCLAMHEWGARVRSSAAAPPKLADPTLERIGYQTDNGAYYVFCRAKNCSATLVDAVATLRAQGLEMGYLSFLGSGACTSDGKAPWCVSTWGVDGGLSRQYPVPLAGGDPAGEGVPHVRKFV